MEKKIRTGDWKMVIEKSNTSQRGSRKSNIIISEEAKCGDWGMFWGTEAGGGGEGFRMEIQRLHPSYLRWIFSSLIYSMAIYSAPKTVSVTSSHVSLHRVEQLMVQTLGNETPQPCHGNEPLGLKAAFASVNYPSEPGKMSYNHKELHSSAIFSSYFLQNSWIILHAAKIDVCISFWPLSLAVFGLLRLILWRRFDSPRYPCTIKCIRSGCYLPRDGPSCLAAATVGMESGDSNKESQTWWHISLIQDYPSAGSGILDGIVGLS